MFPLCLYIGVNINVKYPVASCHGMVRLELTFNSRYTHSSINSLQRTIANIPIVVITNFKRQSSYMFHVNGHKSKEKELNFYYGNFHNNQDKKKCFFYYYY